MRLIVQTFSVLILIRLAGAEQAAHDAAPKPIQVEVRFDSNDIRMIMDNMTTIDYSINVNQSRIAPDILSSASDLVLEFEARTISPQFDIIEFSNNASQLSDESLGSNREVVRLPIETLKNQNFTHNSTINLKATYIGHATLDLKSYLLIKLNNENLRNESLEVLSGRDLIEITVIRHEGMLDKIFVYSVIVFITISYINLGAQIDVDNVKRLMSTPKIVIIGLLIGGTVMPLASWFAGHIFFKDQPMYRVGSFIYACGPAASASVLWTVLFDADKELALGLQIASTISALLTMPILLYAMDKSIDLEGRHTIKVPYANLGRTLLVLVIALVVGLWIVRSSKRAKQISQRIFRPLTMFVLLFIIVFSSIVYWYIYKMFDWNITAMALIVTTTTYIVSGLLGYLIHRNIDHMITISISSTYRNSGIAFAALVVAFQPPDIFIAYVPCLTQVVSTSLIGLVLYSIKSLRNCCNKESR